MDLIQSYLSYVAAALPAPLLVQPPLTLVVDVVGLAVALMNVRARPFAPAGARRLAWLALLVAGLAPLLMSLDPWASTFTPIPAGLWSAMAPGAVLLALLLLAAAARRLARAAVAQPFAALLEIAGLLITAVGLAGVTLPALAAAGWAEPAIAHSSSLPSASISWCVALAGALVVLTANASRGLGSPVPRGRRIGTVLTALAYAVVVTGVTFAPGWLAGTGVWDQFALATHVVNALALLALAGATRHMLNRPSAAEYWARTSIVAPAVRRGRMRAASAPKPAHIVPAVTSTNKPTQVPVLTSMPRPVVPPNALAPFSPPALRRTVIYGADMSATVETVPPRAINEAVPVPVPIKAPLVAPDELPAVAPEASNVLPTGEHAAALGANQASEMALSPQFVEAVLLLQTEMLRAGKHYSFAELVELFAEVQPRAGAMLPLTLGRAGIVELTQGDRPALPAPTEDDPQAPLLPR